MICVYKILIIILSPIIKIWFYFRCLIGKDKLDSVCNHFGVATAQRPVGKIIWIHAASIGESLSALTYIHHIKKRSPNINILFTTITVTSAEIIKKKIFNISGCIHQFIVTDNILWIKKFLNYWNIETAIFLESEIWPNIINQLHKRNIKIYLLNAKLSKKSSLRWKIFKKTFGTLLQKYSCILAQSETNAERFKYFSQNNVQTIDNLKFCNSPLPCNEELFKIFEKILKNKRVFVAASTHLGEEEIILRAHKMLKKKFDIITIFIPRHLTRIEQLCELMKKERLQYALRTDITNNCNKNPDTEIYCVDSFGEVGTFFRLADFCFVGGSLVPIGGHNIYEPITLGRPVMHGPHMQNALETRDLLHAHKVAFEVCNENDIVNTLSIYFNNSTALQCLQNKASLITANNSLNQIDKIIFI